eukprot:CAMPEP_0202845052 /NCGR_PEP_ID=MMETSP1389-20130828/69012_1 /ASSEMBLY_ACC=CAM_ASM_000865 /TAXON_ID=302021 /ORGANISM="Rhodomonas sp., Strain CCMP768" /LENGTH=38 /DNA_ID= /DNA_START= /DNA_END= /DNA_ORIENTATION=
MVQQEGVSVGVVVDREDEASGRASALSREWAGRRRRCR